MEPTKKTARTAGFLYLAIVFGGLFYLRYVPVSIFDRDHMALTIQNLSTHATLFRLGIVAEVACNFFYLLLALTLYKLFSQVNKTMALLLVLFVTIGIAMDFVNMQNRLTILSLMDGVHQFKSFNPEILQDQVLLQLNNYRNGIRVDEIFWGLWLFPLGYLVYQSGVVPKLIGILLMIGCLGYLADFIGSFFFPAYNDLNIANYVIMPASIGELATCLWLMIVGVRKQKRMEDS